MATTLTIDEAKRKQLERFRHPDHESWSEVLEAMMHVLPDAEQMQDEGCCVCGKHSDKDAPIDQYGGVTQFFHAGVPTAVLLVKTDVDPFVPDPLGAKALIDEALEPLVDFSIDTSSLEDRAEAIREAKQQTAAQFTQLSDGSNFSEPTNGVMYQ